jgi:hypothetical protein
MDKNKSIGIIQDLIESTDTTTEQKEALKKAVASMQSDKWLEALRMIVPLLGNFLNRNY